MKYLGVNFGLTADEQLQLERYNDVYEYLQYNHESANKVVLYRLNKELVSRFQETGENAKKYVLYAGHYPSIWAMLSNLKLTSETCLKAVATSKTADANCFGKPVYSSSLVFNVVTKSTTDSTKYVKVIYNGNDVTSRIQGCSDGHCKLETFIETFLPTTMFEDDDAYDKECANYDVHLNSKLIALAVACLIFGVIMLIVFIKLLKQKLKRE